MELSFKVDRLIQKKMARITMILFLLGMYQVNNSQKIIKVNDPQKQLLINAADSTYKSNIKKSRLNGVYIPKNIEEAFLELDRLSPKESLDKIKAADEKLIAKKLHFGLGRWMSYNWNFDEGSRFSQYLKELGLYHTDDMIDFMLISYHRYLNKRPLELTERAKEYIRMREEEKQKSGN